MIEAADPDADRAALTALAARDGVSLAQLSAMIGRNAAYLQQYVRRGTPRRLAERDRRLLADHFGVSERALGGPEPRAAAARVARLDVAVAAGPGAMVDGDILIGSDAVDPALLRRLGLSAAHAAIVRVRGDSMEPGLIDGDHILVDHRSVTPTRSGGLFVVRIDGLIMVKRVRREGGRLIARSDNPAAPDPPEGPVAVIGRVVWQMRVPR